MTSSDWAAELGLPADVGIVARLVRLDLFVRRVLDDLCGAEGIAVADYLVLAEAWDATHSSPPELMGQLLHLFEAPNRFGLPAFYTLHVWAWKDNPTGTFVNWHSNVSCDAFDGQ